MRKVNPIEFLEGVEFFTKQFCIVDNREEYDKYVRIGEEKVLIEKDWRKIENRKLDKKYNLC